MSAIEYVGTPYSVGMFYKVIDKLYARYKIGITATCYRNIKGTEKAIFNLLRKDHYWIRQRGNRR